MSLLIRIYTKKRGAVCGLNKLCEMVRQEKVARFIEKSFEKVSSFTKTPLKKLIEIYILYQKNADWGKCYVEKKDRGEFNKLEKYSQS